MMWDIPMPLIGPVGGPAPPIVTIAAGSVSNQASIDIPWGDQVFDEVNILVDQWTPAANADLELLTSSDNGAIFDNGATDYFRQGLSHNPGASVAGVVGAGDSIPLGSDAGGARMDAGVAIGCFAWTVYRPFDTSLRTVVEGWGGFDHNEGGINSMNIAGSGWRDAAGLVNAVRLRATTGNVSAQYLAWGVSTAP